MCRSALGSCIIQGSKGIHVTVAHGARESRRSAGEVTPHAVDTCLHLQVFIQSKSCLRIKSAYLVYEAVHLFYYV